MTLNVYLGIDVGSVTTKLALVDETGKYIDSYMLRTSGKPVVASNVPGLSDVVRGAGCLFKPQQEDQLANILFRLLADNVYYEQVCEACERRAQQYDKNWMIQDYIRVYEAVVQDEKSY